MSGIAVAHIAWQRRLPIIRSERLLLRVPTTQEAEEMAAYRRDNWDHLSRWEPTRPDSWRTSDYWRTRISSEVQQALAGQSYLFLIREIQHEGEGSASGPLLGTVRVSDVVRANAHFGSIGYGLAASAEGRGYMAEAVRAAVAFAFDEIGLHRLEACVMPANVKSIKVLERTGFEREGLLRGSMLIQNVWEDHLIYGRINENWRSS